MNFYFFFIGKSYLFLCYYNDSVWNAEYVGFNATYWPATGASRRIYFRNGSCGLDCEHNNSNEIKITISFFKNDLLLHIQSLTLLFIYQDNSLQAVWSNGENNRKLIRYDINMIMIFLVLYTERELHCLALFWCQGPWNKISF